MKDISTPFAPASNAHAHRGILTVLCFSNYYANNKLIILNRTCTKDRYFTSGANEGIDVESKMKVVRLT